MKTRPLRSFHQLVWLMLVALAMARPAEPQRGRNSPLTISIVSIGRAAIEAEARVAAPRLSSAWYYVDPQESIAFKVSGPLPRRALLYPLVRRWGGGEPWRVQKEVLGPEGRNARGEWKGEVQFGGPEDVGGRFELVVAAAVEPLPKVLDGLRRATILSASDAVLVERRRGRPFVGISAVGGTEVDGDREVEVRDLAKVAVVARDLPAEAAVGVVVLPAATDRRWVMGDRSGEGVGEITTFFGTGEPGEDFFRYSVSAFVAWKDQFPREGVAILPQDWAKIQAGLLAESRRVRTIRWEGELKIRTIGGVPVLSNRILLVGPQEDVYGALHRKLHDKERVWIVCIPPQGLPWIAGWTSRLRPSGEWVVNAAMLWQKGLPQRFDVLALLSAQDATRIKRKDLRAWIHNEERPRYSVRVRIKPQSFGEDDALPAAGRRP